MWNALWHCWAAVAGNWEQVGNYALTTFDDFQAHESNSRVLIEKWQLQFNECNSHTYLELSSQSISMSCWNAVNYLARMFYLFWYFTERDFFLSLATTDSNKEIILLIFEWWWIDWKKHLQQQQSENFQFKKWIVTLIWFLFILCRFYYYRHPHM